eukprot:2302994-Pyramimonas_sp.AAC.1
MIGGRGAPSVEGIAGEQQESEEHGQEYDEQCGVGLLDWLDNLPWQHMATRYCLTQLVKRAPARN